MKLETLQKAWDEAAKDDALWSVLSQAGKRQKSDEFFQTGVDEIEAIMGYLAGLGIGIPKNRALDFGCGPGRLSQALARHFDEVDGVDISPSMITLGNRFNRFAGTCRYHLNASDDLAIFPDETFDFVYSNITLQHMEPVYARRYLQEFFRLLRRDGVLIFQLPGRRTGALRRPKRLLPLPVLAAYRRMRYGDHPAASMHGIPREEVLRFCDENGARVIDVQSNQEAGKGWESFRYCCRRSRTPLRAS